MVLQRSAVVVISMEEEEGEKMDLPQKGRELSGKSKIKSLIGRRWDVQMNRGKG
jgi:hypothetical protein